MKRESSAPSGLATVALMGCGAVAVSWGMVEATAWARSFSGWGSTTVLEVLSALGVLTPAVAAAGWMLARRCRRRTDQIRQEADRQASRFKDELLANVSHELRTPLTGIVGYAHLLDESILGDSDAEAVSSILGQSAELSRLVDDRLTAARINAGALSFDHQAVSVAQQAREAAGFLKLYGVQVGVDCQDAEVWVDPARLRQALRNLLVNAHQHGRPRIRVSGQIRSDRYILQVIDQGPGVPADAHDRIFQRFTPEGDGPLVTGSAGLGLAVVQELLHGMGSSVSYRHVRGETRFIVSLPLHVGSTSYPQTGITEPVSLPKRPHKRIREKEAVLA